jgi:hypothetical protein
MRSDDAGAFETVMQDLCLAFNRPYTPELSRVFWDSLKHLHIADVRRSADSARKNLKKFPTPKDLTPERAAAPPPPPPDYSGPPMSSWATAANKILFSVAYQGDRGFTAMGDKLRACLAAKADYVEMAENAARLGEAWDEREFNVMCREGFQKLLRDVPRATTL